MVKECTHEQGISLSGWRGCAGMLSTSPFRVYWGFRRHRIGDLTRSCELLGVSGADSVLYVCRRVALRCSLSECFAHQVLIGPAGIT